MANHVASAVAALEVGASERPELALVLGSGLGGLADELESARSISTEDVPGFPVSSVEGHAGRLVFGRLESRPVLAIQGRPHFYEGHDIDAVTFPTRLAHALGARRILLTNAAGGVNPGFGPGTLMLITDHLNLALAGPVPRASSGDLVSRRGPAFDTEWVREAGRVADELGIEHREGVYVWTAGPSYETPAEIRYFRAAGADAVGMSTVPEARQAAALGMRALGISAITNAAAGLNAAPLDHAEVLEVGRRIRDRFAAWVRGIVSALPQSPA
jgi:purine-nucleoside phosphorylase